MVAAPSSRPGGSTSPSSSRYLAASSCSPRRRRAFVNVVLRWPPACVTLRRPAAQNGGSGRRRRRIGPCRPDAAFTPCARRENGVPKRGDVESFVPPGFTEYRARCAHPLTAKRSSPYLASAASSMRVSIFGHRLAAAVAPRSCSEPPARPRRRRRSSANWSIPSRCGRSPPITAEPMRGATGPGELFGSIT